MWLPRKQGEKTQLNLGHANIKDWPGKDEKTVPILVLQPFSYTILLILASLLLSFIICKMRVITIRTPEVCWRIDEGNYKYRAHSPAHRTYSSMVCYLFHCKQVHSFNTKKHRSILNYLRVIKLFLTVKTKLYANWGKGKTRNNFKLVWN